VVLDAGKREFGRRVGGTAGVVREPPALLQPPPLGFAGAVPGTPTPPRERITERSGGRAVGCCASTLAEANVHKPAMSQLFTTIHVRTLCRATVESLVLAHAIRRDHATPRESPPLLQPTRRLVPTKETRLKIDFAIVRRSAETPKRQRAEALKWSAKGRQTGRVRHNYLRPLRPGSPACDPNWLHNRNPLTDNDEWQRVSPTLDSITGWPIPCVGPSASWP
jgi:hypothetical protein